MGAPLVDAAGNMVGMMSAVTRRRLEDARLAEELVQLVSRRAAAELERTRLFEGIERQNLELRRSNEEAAAAKSHLERDLAYLRDEIRIAHPLGAGVSAEFRALMSHVRRAAATSAIALIDGEPGSGKELAARAIHNQSARRNRPLVTLDCAAIPKEFLDVELFGGGRDPHTEAAPRIGRLDFANGGTLLVDEVAEMPLETQAKLLRFIQEQEFRPLGSPRTVKADVRLVLTTNRDLAQAVTEGRFRSDLYQRLQVDPVHVPPLRRRRQDIPVLAERFLSLLRRRRGREGLRVSERMMGRMMAHTWPGNIRELEDLLFRAALAGAGRPGPAGKCGGGGSGVGATRDAGGRGSQPRGANPGDLQLGDRGSPRRGCGAEHPAEHVAVADEAIERASRGKAGLRRNRFVNRFTYARRQSDRRRYTLSTACQRAPRRRRWPLLYRLRCLRRDGRSSWWARRGP